ncbi:furin-like protease 2 [Nilaparvata lugens]|uniref:furin-like protease 2 n=1 Tax=Nilaparvata lugens TaxID=108931 RepID=UPI00193CC1E8|nr:furin-like protease 2 [Nilaparvata lugens]
MRCIRNYRFLSTPNLKNLGIQSVVAFVFFVQKDINWSHLKANCNSTICCKNCHSNHHHMLLCNNANNLQSLLFKEQRSKHRFAEPHQAPNQYGRPHTGTSQNAAHHAPLLVSARYLCRLLLLPHRNRQYYNDVGTCSKCYLSCMTCSGPRRDQCVTCPQGWQLAAGECHPECPQGFFMSQYGCQKCHHYCHTCKGEGPLQCTSCPPQSMLDGGLCQACLGSQYYDPPTQLCKACDSGCKTCSGAGPFSCLSCTFPLHLDKLNNQCVPCCTRQSQQNCCSCDKDTGECHNSSPAGKRRITVEHDIDEIQLQATSLRGEMPLQSNSPSTSFSSGFSLTQQLTSGNAIVVLCACTLILMVAIVVSVQLKSESPGKGYSKFHCAYIRKEMTALASCRPTRRKH